MYSAVLKYLFDHLPEINSQDSSGFLPWPINVQEE